MKLFRVIPCVAILGLIFLTACEQQAVVFPTPSPTGSHTPPAMLATPILMNSPFPTAMIPSTATLYPLPTASIPTGPCNERRPADNDLYTIVTAAFGLAADYSPGDLLLLGNFLPGSVSLPEQQLRKAAAEALDELIAVMKEAGYKPTILSAYRSYYEQVITYNKWLELDPASASLVSALPGHSEHQLGTAVDFGSLDLTNLTGDPTMKFSPLFSETNEGIWLAAHAHEFGFTLTNPPGAQPWTGLTYEPWHYRYVGIHLATYLDQSGYFLAQFLIQARSDFPCVP